MTLRRAPFVLGVLLAAACSDPAPTTGALIVTVDGMPSGAEPSVVVSGPNGFGKSVHATTTLEQLEPGTYTVRALPSSHANATYAAAVSVTTHNVVPGKTENAGVQYALASGAIDLSVAGLPAGISSNIRLVGPNGFDRSVLQGGLIGELPPGGYTIQADTITTADGDRFGTATFIQTVSVPVSLTAVPVSVGYGLVSGTLEVIVSGLTFAQSPPVTITGPSGFRRTTSTSSTYRGLLPGTYTIAATKVYSTCPNVYVPAQTQQTAEISIGSVLSRSVAYSLTQESQGTLNLTIDGAYLIQVSQNYAGTVPMIAGRPGLFRVFGKANQCNSVKPKVRLTLGGTTVDLVLADSIAPTTVFEGALERSWNYHVPGSLIQPGLTFAAEIDPANEIAEADEADNRFPATGTKSIEVKSLPVTGLRVVPVTFSANNTTGNVTSGNVEEFMGYARKLHPVSGYAVDVRQPYTTSKPVLQANNQNGSWGEVLSEIRALRTFDTDTRYYYGVVKAPYTSGIAGIGYIGQPAAIGWDHLPSGSTVLAHELGHNFGRLHTPCGNPGGIDSEYPGTGDYAGGYIGVWGFDAADSSLKNPTMFTDVMGYCRDIWISDYTYVNMMNWIAAHPLTAPSVSTAEQPSLLVWGRIVNGQPVLEPAFEISARPRMPSSGPHRLAALDERGAEIFSIPFAADRVADLPGEEESFAFVVPKSMLGGRALGALRLAARGRTTTNQQMAAVGDEPALSLTRTGNRAVRLRWDATRFPVVMVRDPNTGDVLSFARGGDATIVSGHAELEVNYSNRVGSARRIVPVR